MGRCGGQVTPRSEDHHHKQNLLCGLPWVLRVFRGEKRAWLATDCPATFSRPHPSHRTKWVTAQGDLICVRCGIGLQGFGLKGVCRHNATSHPLRRAAIERDELQLVEDEGDATMSGPPSIWQQVSHGRWQKQETQLVATGGVGNDAAGGEPCAAEGAGLQIVLGARELGFDDPEGDPFAQLEEDELS